jgi:hypothetical protein
VLQLVHRRLVPSSGLATFRVPWAGSEIEVLHLASHNDGVNTAQMGFTGGAGAPAASSG